MHPDPAGATGPGFPRQPSEGWRPALLAGLLLLLVVAAYLPALRCGFIWDDDEYVTDNPMLTAANGLHEIWFSTHALSQYFPLVYTTFRLEHGQWGFNPVGYHLVNVLLHGINAILVWLVLRRLAVPGAWLGAALFALHPVQVETVAWVSELKNIESLFLYLLALLAWIHFVDSPGRTRWGAYGLALTAFLAALFAKTTACTLPAALVLVLWLRGERWSWEPGLANPAVCAGGFGHGCAHHLVGTAFGRPGGKLRHLVQFSTALPDGQPGVVVLRGQTPLAGQSHHPLSPLGH